VTHAVRAFERTPSLGAVYGEGYLIDYDGKIKSRFPATEPFDLWRLIHVSDYVLQQTLYFRRVVFDEVGFLDENLHWGMDWEILMRIGKRFWLEYIPEYMGCLREYDEAKTFSGGHRRFRELAAILRRHGHMRYPPGYFSYGLDTYQRIVGRYTPSQRLRELINLAAVRIYSRKTIHEQQIYGDGWAGRHAKYMFPAGHGKIRIVGNLPAIEALKGQTIEMLCNGQVVVHRQLLFGEFEIEFDWHGIDSQPIFMELKAAKAYVPAKFGHGADWRKLAYILKAIEWSDFKIGTRSAIFGLARKSPPV
jgi:hypothetical protein